MNNDTNIKYWASDNHKSNNLISYKYVQVSKNLKKMNVGQQMQY